MEEIIIKKQRQMTFAETLDFCISSIRHRFMRSLLTLSVVILAVAFFMFLQCSNIFRNSVKDGVEKEILESRKTTRVLNMLYAPITEKDFVSMLVDARKSPGDFDRMAKMLGKDKNEMQALMDSAVKEMIYLRFFDKLPFGKRKELFGSRRDAAQLYFLLEDGELDKALKKMRDLGGIRLPGGNEEFKEFLKNYKKYRGEENQRYSGDLGKAYKTLLDLRQNPKFPNKDGNGKELKDSQVRAQHLLRLHAEKRLDADWRAKLAALNVQITDDEMKSIIRDLEVQDHTSKVKAILSDPQYRVRWRQVYNRRYNRMDEKLAHLDENKTLQVVDMRLRLPSIAVRDEKIADTATDANKLKNLAKTFPIKLSDLPTPTSDEEFLKSLYSEIVSLDAEEKKLRKLEEEKNLAEKNVIAAEQRHANLKIDKKAADEEIKKLKQIAEQKASLLKTETEKFKGTRQDKGSLEERFGQEGVCLNKFGCLNFYIYSEIQAKNFSEIDLCGVDVLCTLYALAMQTKNTDQTEIINNIPYIVPVNVFTEIREYDEMQKELQGLELQLEINTLEDAKGFTPDQIYLMCLSFLVCVVGITNAMLMSITERFREIATLKCLGATDSFILIQIVLEAMIQGVIGGLIGLFVGFIVALISSVFLVGGRVFASFDWSMIGYAALFSLLAGVLLSVLSSLYPSAKAARMAPMEAMRVE